MNGLSTVPVVTRAHPPVALLVDRNVDTRTMYAEFLRQAAWQIEEAAAGPEALAKAISQPPDVIVTETRLPGINGYDLCGLLRRDSATEKIPVVLVAGDAYKDDVRRAEKAGADAVLVKPLLPEKLLATVHDLLEHSLALRSRSAAVRSKMANELARSAELLERSRRTTRKLMLSHAQFRRDTTTPPITPPTLICPRCDQQLIYRRSHIGGVSERHPEQWDYFECEAGCGTFQYRERTRKLRAAL
jgi:chemotaxis family two-component system response regulator PixH